MAASLLMVTCVGGPNRQLNLVRACMIESVALLSITSRWVILVYTQPNTHMCTLVVFLFVCVSLPFLLLRTTHCPDMFKQHTLNGLLGTMAHILRLPDLCGTVLLLCFLHGMHDLLILLKICSALGVIVYADKSVEVRTTMLHNRWSIHYLSSWHSSMDLYSKSYEEAGGLSNNGNLFS